MSAGGRAFFRTLVLGTLVVLAAGPRCQGGQPEGRDLFIAVRNDRIAEVAIRVHDADLVEGSGHELVFTLLRRPSHGELLGDLRHVTYDWEEKVAAVRLGYVPQVNYVGRDEFSVLVVDSFGLSATVVVRLDVRGLTRPKGMSLSGTWDLSISLDSGGPPAGVSGGLSLFWRIDDLTGEVRAGFGATGLSDFTVLADYTLGALAAVRATLSFDPSALAFSYLEARSRIMLFRFYNLDVTHTLRFTGEESSSYQRLTVRGSLGGTSFASDLTFGFHTLEFREWTVSTSGGFICCDLRLATRFTFRKSGFQELRLELRDVPLTTCGPFVFKLQVPVVFTVDRNTVEPQISLESGWVCCTRVRAELVGDGTTISGIHLYGFEVKFEVPPGIEIWAGTSLDPSRNAWVTGYPEYFEVWWARGSLAPCCGLVGTWRIATYFHDQAGVSLFGWGMTEIMLDVPLGTVASLKLEFAVQQTTSLTEVWKLNVGTQVRW